MDADRWQRLNEVFHAALALEPGERRAFVAESCAGDESLRRESEELLSSHERADIDLGAIERFEAALDEPASPGLAGLRLGPYRVSQEIGRGGMSAVWLADRADGQFEQHVAIKVIKRGMDTAQVLERFRAERQILASLDHPNIAHLIDGGTTDDGLPYVVMEHIQGQSIDEYVDERRLPVRERLGLFLQVCDAVSYAHRHLVVHRDIKPQNILVTADGLPKLLDFGIAKILQEASDPGGHTVSGSQLLTPDYASPEQIEGRATTTQTDVYSLGVVLYELLTGQSPYRPRTWSARDVCDSVLTSNIERPSTAVGRPADEASMRGRTAPEADGFLAKREAGVDRLRAQLRGDLDAILLTALRKEPERRYPSVEQLAGDIRRYLNGLPVRARPDSLWYRGTKFVRRNRVAVTAGALVAIALVGGAIATAWQAREARVQAHLAREAQARAERRFLEVRKLANALLFEYHDAIKVLPGATAIREQLVRDALDYLNGLAQDAIGDVSLQRELALAYRRVAEVQGGLVGSATLGDTAGAIESHRKSLSILENLHRARPDDRQARLDVAEGTLQLADLLALTEDQSEALALARRARDLYEPLVAASAPSLDQRLALAHAYGAIGAISLESGKAREALEVHQRQIDLLESAPESDRNDPALRRAVATAYMTMADAQGTFGDVQAAVHTYRRSLETFNALATEFPHNTEYRRLAGSAQYWEADALFKLGQTREALDGYLRSLAVDEELAAGDPKAERSTFSMLRVGNMLDRLGDHQQAVSYYERAHAILATQVGADPGNLWKRGGLIEVQAYTCAALTALAMHAAASAACDEAVQLIEQTSVEPTNAVIRASLARSYKTMADALITAAAERGSPTDQRVRYAYAAREMYEKSVAIWSDMATRGMLTESDDEEAAAVSASFRNAATALTKLTAAR
jgi:non-specific serine/threonine protein kinase/serine/threonine-protein kinase